MSDDSVEMVARVVVPLAVAVVALVSGILGLLLGAWAQERERRRTGYAETVAALVAWSEYPYRVRRRVSDDPEALRSLADCGHELQERLARAQTWIDAESTLVGGLYAEVLGTLKARAGPLLRDAWDGAPITTAAAMNLADWGYAIPLEDLRALQRAIANRFGWRRALLVNHFLRRRFARNQTASPSSAVRPPAS